MLIQEIGNALLKDNNLIARTSSQGKRAEPGKRLRWNDGLDLARTVAVFLVLYAHSRTLLTGLPAWRDSIFAAFLEEFFRPGWWGVQIFFSLSGFLIGREIIQIIASGSTRQGGLFLARRWIRTVPTFWVVLTITAIDNGVALYSPEFWRNALFLNTAVIEQSGNSLVAVGWSLAIEEWSYAGLGMAALIACLARKRITTNTACAILAAICILAITGSIITRISVAENLELTFEQLKKTTSLQLDSLAYGALMACISTAAPERWNQIIERPFPIRIIVLTGMSATGFYLKQGFLAEPGPLSALDAQILGGLIYPVSAVLCCLFCLGLWRFQWRGSLSQHLSRPARALSKISYSVYLTHLPLQRLPIFTSTSAHATPLTWAAYMAASIIVGYIFWCLAEFPFIAIRRRLH